MSSNTTKEVFEYTGYGQRVPTDVVCVRFHPSVVEVDDEAFQNNRNLREVVFNEGLVKISRGAFKNCLSLESITTSSVTQIDYMAFYCCTKLREVVLNEGLEKIGKFVFTDCKSLQSVTIPSSVTEIGNSAFNNCSNLREVVCIERLPKFEQDTFNYCPALERITFPDLSSRLEDIIQAGQLDIQNKIQQQINRGGIEWRRGGTIRIPVEVMRRRDIWKELKQRVDQIVEWIKYYEMKEATTIFELALWKAKIDEDDTYVSHRDAYRVDIPGPVKDAILQYLH